jgi:hypothetical protein
MTSITALLPLDAAARMPRGQQQSAIVEGSIPTPS